MHCPTFFFTFVVQFWELLEWFHEILDLKKPLLSEELENELINPWFDELDLPKKSEREIDGSQVLSSQRFDGNYRLICEVGPSGST